MNISTLKDIKNASINVCFIQGNRQVSNKNEIGRASCRERV